MSRAAVFVDRDGVINELVPDPVSGQPESPLDLRDVRIVPGAPAALLALRDAGYSLVGVSNQPAAAKGTTSTEALQAVQDRVLALLAQEGVRFDAFEMCLHHPEGVVEALAGACNCRKPAPGMLLRAAQRLDLDLAASWMLGDTDADAEAGRAAGCRTVLVEHPGSVHKRAGETEVDLRARDIGAAASRILGAEPLP